MDVEVFMIINLSIILIDVLLLLFIFESFEIGKKKLPALNKRGKKENANEQNKNILPTAFTVPLEAENISIQNPLYSLESKDSFLTHQSTQSKDNSKLESNSIIDELKKKNILFRIQSHLNQKNLISTIDELYTLIPKDKCKRLVVIPYQKNFNSYNFYFLSDLKKFYETNICKNMYDNLDLLVQFPRISSMFSGSLLEWFNLQLEQYQEVYVILDAYDYDLWKKTPSIDIYKPDQTSKLLQTLN